MNKRGHVWAISMTRAVEEALAGEPFSVNPIACSQAAQVLRKYKAPVEEHPWSKLSLPVQLSFKIAFVSVCHAFNWDFLQGRMAAELLKQPDQLVARLASLSANEFGGWLRDYPKQERVKATERSKLLRNVGKVIQEKWGGDSGELLACCAGRINGASGFLTLLDEFDAFRVDPLRKKSQVLVHDLLREGAVDFVDKEEVLPAIDYHIMRTYLRTGRVVPRKLSLNPYLAGHPNPRPRLVRKLRESVAKAAELTAFYAKISVPDLNYVEWQIGRAICDAIKPSCTSVDLLGLPRDVSVLLDAECPYAGFCEAHLIQQYSMYQEPRFDKGFY